MFNAQNDEVIDIVDFYLNVKDREFHGYGDAGSSQLTVRVPDSLRDDLDILCAFLGGITRNGLINEFLEAAVRKAIPRIDDNPYVTGQTINDLTFSQTRAAARLARKGSAE